MLVDTRGNTLNSSTLKGYRNALLAGPLLFNQTNYLSTGLL